MNPWLVVFVCSVCAWCGRGAGAAEPPPAATPLAPPAWGTIDTSAAAIGRYRFVIDRPPADGRIAVPAGFPPIIRATRESTAAEDVRVEYGADAAQITLLAEHGGAAAGAVAIETADATRQFDDGRIVFSARDAQVTGTKAKLEEHPGNARIGFWTDASDTVSWSRKASRWGMYDVRLSYSTASPSGTEIAVDVGGTTLSGTLASTSSWYRYATLPLGKVYLPAAGEQTVTVRCTKQVGGAVMNLKAVTLTPACEGAPPVQADDGTITLHGRDATVLGTALRYEPAEKKQTLGFWTRAGDAAVWSFSVRQPGAFDVEVLQGCGTGQGGSTVQVTVDPGRVSAATVDFTVEDTGGFQAFRPRVIGRVRLDAQGDHELRVQPRSIAKAAACDIRQIRLIPVAR
jgi:hypothetical protein